MVFVEKNEERSFPSGNCCRKPSDKILLEPFAACHSSW